jgi:general secretion pathway protein A
VWWLSQGADPVAASETPATAVAAEPTEADTGSEIAPDPATPLQGADVVEEAIERPTLNEQLQIGATLTTTANALTSLFEVWGLEYQDSAKEGCAQASDAGLACLYQRGSWSGLRQMDRPAILTLVDDNGDSHKVLLTAIHDDTAELSIGGVLVEHPVSDVLQSWFGQYMLLWRPVGGTPVSLRPGSRNDSVLWLRRSLASISPDYATTNVESDAFDAELERIVRQFQRDHRLGVDGLAGQQTQIVINSLLAADGTPRLTMPMLAAME